VYMAKHIQTYRESLEIGVEQSREAGGEYFSKDLGFAYRFTRWTLDDELVAYTEAGHHTGYAYARWLFLNWFPHVVFPDKDRYAVEGAGNYYAREMGVLSPTDYTTGISVGLPAEAYHMDGYVAVLMYQPVLWFMALVSTQWICGDTRRAPWGVLVATFFSHVAPESGANGLMLYMWETNLGLIVCIAFSVYVAPVLGAALIADRNGMRRGLAAAPAGA